MFANNKLLQTCGDTFSEVINTTDIFQTVEVKVNSSDERCLTLPGFDVGYYLQSCTNAKCGQKVPFRERAKSAYFRSAS